MLLTNLHETDVGEVFLQIYSQNMSLDMNINIFGTAPRWLCLFSAGIRLLLSLLSGAARCQGLPQPSNLGIPVPRGLFLSFIQ